MTKLRFENKIYCNICVCYRNTLSAPSKFNSYAGSIFPSLTDALYEVDHTAEADRDWVPVKKAFAIVTYYIVSATSTLQQSTWFTKM